MTEEKLEALRQTDNNLHDALLMDEAELPQMPANLNERLMQRVTSEQKKPRRIVWPWIAAACVAGIMMIWLTPPKEQASSPLHLRAERETATPKTEMVGMEVAQPAEPQLAEVKTLQKVSRKPRKQQPKTIEAENNVPTAVVETIAEVPQQELAQATEPKAEKPVTLTERDIPITRPENYHYTAEEIALMKKQANEAYLKWAQLELEIAKYNLEQTARK